MKKLIAHHANSVNQFDVEVDYHCDGIFLLTNFIVTAKSDFNEWQTSKKFENDYKKNWGLWDFDVVEIFIQNRKLDDEMYAPYLEFQVSPLNQPFALDIIKPREKYFSPEVIDFETKVDVAINKWKTNIKIKLPFDVISLYGNFHACLGTKEKRQYFSLNPNKEERPDFHLPKNFIKL